MTRKRRPYEVFPEELEESSVEADQTQAILELAAMVDALASQQSGQPSPQVTAMRHHVLGPAGGQFDITTEGLVAPTRRTLTWFKACCNPCFLKPNPTTKQDGCPPAPPVSIIPNC